MSEIKTKLLQKLAARGGVVADLGDAKALAKAQIDESAERVRQRFITSGAGQAMVYQEKAAEAQACQAVIDGGGTPVEADYPHLTAEIGTTGADLAEVAGVVLAKRTQWLAVSAQIETLRATAKADIDAIDPTAPDAEAAIRTAMAITWPQP